MLYNISSPEWDCMLVKFFTEWVDTWGVNWHKVHVDIIDGTYEQRGRVKKWGGKGQLSLWPDMDVQEHTDRACFR